MKKSILTSGLVLCLTSCSRYIEWGKQTFKQADRIEYDRSVVTSYMRQCNVYNQFNTVTLCDVLWLSPAVRTEYVNVYTLRRGITEKAEQSMRKRQEDEAQRWWSFYVLMTPQTDNELLFSTTDSNATWIPSLRVDGVELPVHSIKRIDLEPEYRYLLGSAVTRYRVPYLFMFKKTKEAHDICLMIRSVQYELQYEWGPTQVKPKG